MQKMKQILAILGIVLILGVNILLVFTAGNVNEGSTNAFNASIVAVVIVPVLLWVYLYMFKLVKKKNKDSEDEMDES